MMNVTIPETNMDLTVLERLCIYILMLTICELVEKSNKYINANTPKNTNITSNIFI